MIIFDFDGTLADSMEASFRIYNRIAPDFNLAPIEVHEIPELRHLGLRGIMKKLEVKPRHLPQILSRGRLMLRDQMNDLQPCAGVLEQLGELRSNSVKFGILTSNSVENVEIFLRRHGVRHYFDFISTCTKLRGKSKHLRSIARTYSLQPWDMIYVGDEVRDVKAAQRAGVRMAGVTWGFNSHQALAALSPEWLLTEPVGLRELLVAIERPTTRRAG